jgi:hypothetical protein
LCELFRRLAKAQITAGRSTRTGDRSHDEHTRQAA